MCVIYIYVYIYIYIFLCKRWGASTMVCASAGVLHFALYLCFLGILKCVRRQLLAIHSYCMLTRHTHTSCVSRVHHFISRALPSFQASLPCPVAPKLEVGARRQWTDDRSGLYGGNRGSLAVSPVLPYCSCVSACNNWSRTTTFVMKTRCLAHFTVCVCACVRVCLCVCVCVPMTVWLCNLDSHLYVYTYVCTYIHIHSYVFSPTEVGQGARS